MKGQKQNVGERNLKDREHDGKNEIRKESDRWERKGGERARTKEWGRTWVPFFLMRQFKGARQVAIQDMLSGGNIILPHACPRVAHGYYILGSTSYVFTPHCVVRWGVAAKLQVELLFQVQPICIYVVTLFRDMQLTTLTWLHDNASRCMFRMRWQCTNHCFLPCLHLDVTPMH